EWNATDESANRTVSQCHRHGNGGNCTDKEQWDDHFSKCPEELMYYCIHGDCRYIKDQNTPSCRCQRGYIGSRCEYMDLDWLKGDKRQILIICVVTGLVLLILLLRHKPTRKIITVKKVKLNSDNVNVYKNLHNMNNWKCLTKNKSDFNNI
uniref:Betacellulin, epidermal growth factor family member n=1 Tax=Sphaeramia orbicularis TaxID=375764 RepID=A0A673C9T4_9TELE